MADFTTRLRKAASGFLYAFVAQDEAGFELFRFEATRLQHQRGGLLADVAVFSNISSARTVPGGRSGFITRNTVNLLSPRDKSSLVQELSVRIPAPRGASGIDWSVVVEEFAQAVCDSDAERPAVLDLSTVTPTFETPYLVPYLLPEHKATILYGAGGTGKSIFASAIAAAVQTGSRLLGWPCEKRNVLYLDWETDSGDLARRNALVCAGLGITSPAPVLYVKPGRPLTDHEALGFIAQVVLDENIGLLIIDSTVMAMPGSEDRDPAIGAREFFDAIRILDTTTLAIDHLAGEDMRKPGQMTKPYGSVFKWNIARNVFEMRYIEDKDHLVLKHRKTNVGSRMSDKVLRLTWAPVDDGGVRFSEERSASSLYVMHTDTRVLEVVKVAEPARPYDIMVALNADKAYDSVTLMDVMTSIRSLEGQSLVWHEKGRDVVHLVQKAHSTEDLPVEQTSLTL